MTNDLWFMGLLCVVGIINTIYLSYHTFTQKPVKCIFFPAEWCYKVQFSSYSKTFGIPNSFAGFGIYSLLLILIILFVKGTISFAPIVWLVSFGFAFSMYFLAVQAFVLRAFCTWCVLSAVEFTLLLVIVLKNII